LLEPIRHFAAVRCESAAEAAPLRERHLEWFLAVAERAAPSLLSGSRQAQSLAALEADHPNLLAALHACEAVRDGGPKALRLAGSAWLFWYIRGHFARGREALDRALRLPGADAPTPARAQALFAAGGLALFQGEFGEGRRLSQAARTLYDALGDRLGVARSVSHLALCESGEGRYDEARDAYQLAIDLFREAGDARRLSAALNNQGVLWRQLGDFHAALANHAEALELLRQADDRDGMIVTLVNLGLASQRTGDTAAAGRWIDEALAHVHELRAKRAAAAALEVTAELLAGRLGFEDAARLFGAAAALRSAMGLTADEWWRRNQLALADRLRQALGAERFEQRMAEGGERTFEHAVDDARRMLGVETSTARGGSS
jgi:tetratricopeptide (TPR) repeat protein